MPPLPYDTTPPPEETMDAGPETSNPLDLPLSDYTPAADAVPEHVQALVGRMSKGKVYLLEESPAVVNPEAQQRVRGDPRIAALAEQLDEHDPTEWLNVVTSSAPSRIRHTTLYIRSDLIKHLSTSKMFSWVTDLGTSVMGIEWLNDTTLLLLFPSASTALLALTLLSKAGFDPAEGDDPLLERSAHPIPLSLLTHVDPQLVRSQAGEELLNLIPESEPIDGVRRRGRGGFRTGILADIIDPNAGVSRSTDMALPDELDLHARVTVRFAVEDDVEIRQKASQSEWYARNGRKAGKERLEDKRFNPYDRPNKGVWEGSEDAAGYTAEGGEGRDLSRRIGRGRGDRRGRGRAEGADRGTRAVNDLDRELERIQGGAEPTSRSRRGDRAGGGTEGKGKRGKTTQEDLDKELDSMFE